MRTTLVAAIAALLGAASTAEAGWGYIHRAGRCGTAFYAHVGALTAFTAYHRGYSCGPRYATRSYPRLRRVIHAPRYAYYPNRGYRPYHGARVHVYYPSRTYYRHPYRSSTRYVRVTPRYHTVRRTYRYRYR
jgi:hypothetical protein